MRIAVTVLAASAAALAGAALTDRIAPHLARVPVLAPHAAQIALVLVVAFVCYSSIVVGELVPKSLALRSAERYALLLARPLLWLSIVARPLVWIFTLSSNAILRPLGDRTTFAETHPSAEELQQLVSEAAKSGAIDPGVGEIASRALEFADLTAADVMVPRQEVVLVPRNAPLADIQRILLEHAHTRVPVYQDHIDNVVGYISVKDVLALAWEHKLIVLEDLMRPAHFVPETKRAADLVREMREQHVPLMIVVDEQGGMSGIVTFEDVVEELVGEMFSEHRRDAPQAIVQLEDGSAVVAGTTPVRDVNRQLGLALPDDGDFITIAGLCLARAHRIPRSGDTVRVSQTLVIEVLDASPRCVRTVKLRRRGPPPT